jgi:galactokinase
MCSCLHSFSGPGESGGWKVVPEVMPDSPSASPLESGQVAMVKKAFVETYGGPEEDVRVFFAPGRVNLIGDHTDYNGGLVLPATISLGIYAAARYTASPQDPGRVFRARSLDAKGEVCLRVVDLERGEACPGPASLDNEPVGMVPSPVLSGSWTAYPEGVVRFLIKDGLPVPGCDILYTSDLPIGAGLSSSAALELVTAYSLLRGADVDRVWLAKLCRRVENEFVGVQCGIMDQFAVAMGKRGHAILLDCDAIDARNACATSDDCETPVWQYVPLNTGDYRFVIMDSRKERSLAASAYNERRAQCTAALSLIAKHRRIANLCQASLEDVRRYVDDRVLQKRARHVVTEHLRTKAAADLLRQGKVAELGVLMVESHSSLRDDYEVTGLELDALVEAALQIEGCAGARMTGAGFGGCAPALVRSDCVEAFKEQVSRVYCHKAGLSPAFYLLA